MQPCSDLTPQCELFLSLRLKCVTVVSVDANVCHADDGLSESPSPPDGLQEGGGAV